MKKSMVFFVLSSLVATLMLGATCGNSNPPTQPKEKIAITSPSLAQKVVAGDTLLVTWTQSVASPKVSYNYNQGAGWQEFSSSSLLPVNSNSVKVILPTSSYTDSFQVKVEDNGGKYDVGLSQSFSIKYIVITNPVAGQTLANPSTVSITWKNYPSKVNNLRFILSTDGGMTFGDMLTNAVDPSQGSFSWAIGSELGSGSPFAYPSSNCVLKIEQYNQNSYNDQTGTFSVQ